MRCAAPTRRRTGVSSTNACFAPASISTIGGGRGRPSVIPAVAPTGSAETGPRESSGRAWAICTGSPRPPRIPALNPTPAEGTQRLQRLRPLRLLRASRQTERQETDGDRVQGKMTGQRAGIGHRGDFLSVSCAGAGCGAAPARGLAQVKRRLRATPRTRRDRFAIRTSLGIRINADGCRDAGRNPPHERENSPRRGSSHPLSEGSCHVLSVV